MRGKKIVGWSVVCNRIVLENFTTVPHCSYYVLFIGLHRIGWSMA